MRLIQFSRIDSDVSLLTPSTQKTLLRGSNTQENAEHSVMYGLISAVATSEPPPVGDQTELPRSYDYSRSDPNRRYRNRESDHWSISAWMLLAEEHNIDRARESSFLEPSFVLCAIQGQNGLRLRWYVAYDPGALSPPKNFGYWSSNRTRNMLTLRMCLQKSTEETNREPDEHRVQWFPLQQRYKSQSLIRLSCTLESGVSSIKLPARLHPGRCSPETSCACL